MDVFLRGVSVGSLKAYTWVILATIFSLYIATTYNACSQVAFEQPVESASQSPGGDQGGLGNDPDSPDASSFSLLIDNGAPFSKNDSLNLSLKSPDAHEMKISENQDCSGGSWETFAAQKAWAPSQKNRLIFISARFKTQEGDESPCVQDSILHDDTPPLLEFNEPANYKTSSHQTEVNFAVYDTVSGIHTWACGPTAQGPWAQCADYKFLQLHPVEGNFSTYVKALDLAGNVLEPTAYKWVVDRTPPQIQVNGPSSPNGSSSATFTYVATDNLSEISKYECRLESSGAWGECPSSGYTVSNLTEGSHSFSVRATDEAGNVSTPATHTWVIDLSAPSVEILSGPALLSSSSSASFTFRAEDEGQNLTNLKCSLDGAPFESCSSPKTYSGLTAEKNYTFTVRAYDSVGNWSSASFQWKIDLSAPQLSLTASPSHHQIPQISSPVSSSKTQSFQILATDSNGLNSVTCQIDSGSLQDCKSGALGPLTDLSEGQHKVKVVAIDKAGNSTELEYNWIIDSLGPNVVITDGPGEGSGSVTGSSYGPFTFQHSGAGTIPHDRFECRIDGGSFETCSSPKAYASLPGGSHIFYVRSVDKLGNAGATATYDWSVDGEGPAISFLRYPQDGTQPDTPFQIDFSVTDALSGVNPGSVQCGFEGQLSGCNVTHNLQTQISQAGRYTFKVMAADLAGNTSVKTVSFDVTYDSHPVTQLIEVQNSNTVDILFVVDNSISMGPEQSNMAQRMDGFISKLAGLDWRAAVISTDVSTSYWGSSKPRDGKLYPIDSNQFPNRYWLTNQDSTSLAQIALGETIQMGSDGSGYEQGIRASYRAIERSKFSGGDNQPNREFFREDAALAIVLISDEEETGDDLKNTPQGLLDLVEQTWQGQKNFTFHSIIIKPAIANEPADTACFDMQNNQYQAYYGYKYAELSQLTGYGEENGAIIGSVCAMDYATQLQDIGNSVRNFQKTLSLNCAPLDENFDGVPDVEITFNGSPFNEPFTASGQKLFFEDYLLPGTYEVRFSCQ